MSTATLFRTLALTLFVIAIGGLSLPRASAIALNTPDDFESETTLNWETGIPHPMPPFVVTTGGPTGAGDAFLRNVSFGGNGAGSKLVSYNTAQWAGDYIAAGVTGITMDARNSGNTNLTIRFALLTSNFEWFSTSGVNLPKETGWTTITIPITPDTITPVGLATDTTTQALQSVSTLRVLSAVNPTNIGDTLAATLDLDNIRAVTSVPEPNALFALATGAAILGVWRRRAVK